MPGKQTHKQTDGQTNGQTTIPPATQQHV